MKKTLIIFAALFALVAMIACNDKTDNKELIVGKWEVQTCYHWYHDFTDESLSFEEISAPADTNYIGYNSAEFNADGTSRWHMNDRYVQGGMFTDPFRHFNWCISEDSLFVYTGTLENAMWKFAIKELDGKNLVVEEYTNNGHQDYSHHHWEQILRYTFKRER